MWFSRLEWLLDIGLPTDLMTKESNIDTVQNSSKIDQSSRQLVSTPNLAHPSNDSFNLVLFLVLSRLASNPLPF